MSGSGISIGDPVAPCPPPNNEWDRRPVLRRVHAVNEIIKKLGYDTIRAVSAPDNGYIEVKVPDDMPAAARGASLLRIEAELQNVYGGVYVLVRPMDDRNRLRRLRGITVK